MKLTKFRNIALLIIVLSTHSMLFAQCFQSAVAPVKGVFYIEAESEPATEGWEEKSTGDITGITYLEWTGEDHFNEPGIGTIDYSVYIKKPGTYTFYWRSKVGLGDDPTEHNDTWLRFPDAHSTFAVKETDTIRPHGICIDDCPEGSGSDGWYKMFSSYTTDWTWTSRTSDNHGHQIRVKYDHPDVYLIQLSGRSNAHQIDKMILFPHYITLNEAILK